MGDEGPCGPCSEIIYDLGENVGCEQPTCAVGCDCDRYLEIWNLVFMQYERARDGSMTKLPTPPSTRAWARAHRLGASGEDRQLRDGPFRAASDQAGRVSGQAYGEKEATDIAFRVIADHVRGATFIVNDGVLPSKEGRGYVLRRILRRALRYGKKIGLEGDFLSDLSRLVVDMMDDVYPR